LNSTGKWKILAGGNLRYNWQSLVNQQGIGYDNFEIRFTGTSQYYLSGHTRGFQAVPAKNDSLALDSAGNALTLPFTIWNVGRDYIDPSDDYQLAIKVLDNDFVTPSRAVYDLKWTQRPNGQWEEIYAYDVRPQGFDPSSLPITSGLTTTNLTVHKFGQFVIDGEIPEPGTIIRLNTWKGLSGYQGGDKFRLILPKSAIADGNVGKENIDKITVFPNPYFGAHGIEANKYERFMRFTGMPAEATIRIVSLAGVFITRLEKDATTQYVDWNLQNSDGLPVASGVYIAYIDMPGIGTKILKLAVIQETQYIDRI
jgi:hypothetical protein